MIKLMIKHWLATSLVVASLLALAVVEVASNGPGFIAYMQADAIAHDMVPTETMACKTAKSCRQRELQHSFALQQRAEMRTFQHQQRERDKLIVKPQETAIHHNHNLSVNQQRDLIKALLAQQKVDDKQEMTRFKIHQRDARTQNNAEIKAILKNM
jgi:ABC-type uncharacterized transport system auxiliary subunit